MAQRSFGHAEIIRDWVAEIAEQHGDEREVVHGMARDRFEFTGGG